MSQPAARRAPRPSLALLTSEGGAWNWTRFERSSMSKLAPRPAAQHSLRAEEPERSLLAQARFAW